MNILRQIKSAAVSPMRFSNGFQKMAPAYIRAGRNQPGRYGIGHIVLGADEQHLALLASGAIDGPCVPSSLQRPRRAARVPCRQR
jgi:hypothetical protein